MTTTMNSAATGEPIHSLEGVRAVLERAAAYVPSSLNKKCAEPDLLPLVYTSIAYLATLAEREQVQKNESPGEAVAYQWRFKNDDMPDWSAWKDGAPPPACKISEAIGERIETRALYPHPDPRYTRLVEALRGLFAELQRETEAGTMFCGHAWARKGLDRFAATLATVEPSAQSKATEAPSREGGKQ